MDKMVNIKMSCSALVLMVSNLEWFQIPHYLLKRPLSLSQTFVSPLSSILIATDSIILRAENIICWFAVFYSLVFEF